MGQNDYVYSKLSFFGPTGNNCKFFIQTFSNLFYCWYDHISVNDVGQVGDIIVITPLHVWMADIMGESWGSNMFIL